MNTFFAGILVGVVLFAVVYTLVRVQYIATMVAAIQSDTLLIKAQISTLTALTLQVSKTAQATMVASENFVDALRNSAESMGMFGPPRPPMMGDSRDHFKDLRNSFEDGINRFEDDEEDEGPEEPKEDWKKK